MAHHTSRPRWQAEIKAEELVVQEAPSGGADWWTGGLEIDREQHGLIITEFDRQRMVALSATETIKLLDHLLRHEQMLRSMAESETEALKSTVLRERSVGE